MSCRLQVPGYRFGTRNLKPANLLTCNRGTMDASSPGPLVSVAAPRPDERDAASLSRQLARLAAIHRINRAATASLNLDETLQTVVSVVAEATGSDTCTVYLYSP